MKHRVVATVVGVYASLVTIEVRAEPPPGVVVGMVPGGNLRISLRCAEHFLTPGDNLTVTLDGAPISSPVIENGYTTVGYDKHGNPFYGWATSDYGYLVAPGHHQVKLETPDCAAYERDLDVSGMYAEDIGGRLAISNSRLLGPVGAPDGIGVTGGAFYRPYPAGFRAGSQGTGIEKSSYTTEPASANGVSLSTSLERRYLVVAFDSQLGWGSMTGMVSSPTGLSSSIPYNPGPFGYTGSVFDLTGVARVGMRVPMHSVALEAGTGLGGTGWFEHGDQLGAPILSNGVFVYATAPTRSDWEWFVPVWASITIKPRCDWGVQATASYELALSSGAEPAVSFTAGLLFQPSASCREATGVIVTP